jgi:hypothetical protein
MDLSIGPDPLVCRSRPVNVGKLLLGRTGGVGEFRGAVGSHVAQDGRTILEELKVAKAASASAIYLRLKRLIGRGERTLRNSEFVKMSLPKVLK